MYVNKLPQELGSLRQLSHIISHFPSEIWVQPSCVLLQGLRRALSSVTCGVVSSRSSPGRILFRGTHVPVASFRSFQVAAWGGLGSSQGVGQRPPSVSCYIWAIHLGSLFPSGHALQERVRESKQDGRQGLLFCFCLISLLFRTTTLRCEDMWKAVHIQCVQLREWGITLHLWNHHSHRHLS